MKKGLKLLSLILASSALVVNADTIDMHGEYFSDDTLYSSGDVYTNVMFVNDAWGLFGSEFAGLYYLNYPPVATPYYLEKSHPMSEFYTYILNYSDSNIFDIDNYSQSNFIIPKYFNKDILWKHHLVHGEDASFYDSNIGAFEDDDVDEFLPLMIKPKFEIVCNNENVNYGESTTCTLSYSFGLFDDERYVPTMLDLTIDSNEYNISNITVNEISSLNVNGNNISGNALDSKKVNELIQGANITSNEEFLDFMSKYFTYSEECLYRSGDRSSRLGVEAIDLLNCYSSKNYKINIATFDITPKENLSLNGTIKLSKSNIGIYDAATNEELIKYTKAETESVVPIIGGEVKGVEEVSENPKTGLVNYIYLLPLVLISAYVYHFIKKNKELFR